jgi:HEAT repeat protein
VVESAVRALSGIGGADTIPAMAALLKSTDANLRMTAAEALGKTKNKDAIAPLLALVSDANEVVACTALAAIEQLHANRNSSARQQQAAELLAALRGALKDERWRVRAAAVEVVGKLEVRELVSAVKTLLNDADGFVVKNALDALSQLSGTPDTAQLAALAKRHPGLRSQVVTLLIQQSDAEAAKAVEEIYQGSDTGERVAILRQLFERDANSGSGTIARWKTLFTQAATSPEVQLRRAAAGGLAAQPAKVAAPLVGDLLADADAETRSAAAVAVLAILSGEKSRSSSGNSIVFMGLTDSNADSAKPKTNAPVVSAEQIAAWHTVLKQKQGDNTDLVTAAAIFVTGVSNREFPVLETALARADRDALQKFAESPALAAVIPRLGEPEGQTVMERLSRSPRGFVQLLRHVPPGTPLSDYLFEPARFRAAIEPATGADLEMTVPLLLSTPTANWTLLSEHPRVRPAIAALLESTNLVWQAAALYASIRQPEEKLLPRLEQAAQHSNSWLRAVAVRGLAKLSPDRPTLELRVGPLLTDTNKLVARRAALALLEPEVSQAVGVGYELETFVFDKIHGGHHSYSYSSSGEQRPLAALTNRPAFLEAARQHLAAAKLEELPPFVLLLAQYGDFTGVERLIAQLAAGDEAAGEWYQNIALTGIALSKDGKHLPFLKKLVGQANDSSDLQQVLQALRGMSGAEVRELRVEINRKLRAGFN